MAPTPNTKRRQRSPDSGNLPPRKRNATIVFRPTPVKNMTQERREELEKRFNVKAPESGSSSVFFRKVARTKVKEATMKLAKKFAEILGPTKYKIRYADKGFRINTDPPNNRIRWDFEWELDESTISSDQKRLVHSSIYNKSKLYFRLEESLAILDLIEEDKLDCKFLKGPTASALESLPDSERNGNESSRTLSQAIPRTGRNFLSVGDDDADAIVIDSSEASNSPPPEDSTLENQDGMETQPIRNERIEGSVPPPRFSDVLSSNAYVGPFLLPFGSSGQSIVEDANRARVEFNKAREVLAKAQEDFNRVNEDYTRWYNLLTSEREWYEERIQTLQRENAGLSVESQEAHSETEKLREELQSMQSSHTENLALLEENQRLRGLLRTLSGTLQEFKDP